MLLRRNTNPLSHRIQPYIPSHLFQLLNLPQNPVVIPRLPKPLPHPLLISKSRLLFERRHEFNQLGRRRQRLGQNMQMIRHGAVRVNREIAPCRRILQSPHNPTRNGFFQENRPPFTSTQSEKIQLLPDIPRRIQPYSLPRQHHAANLTQPPNVAPGFSPALPASKPHRQNKLQSDQIIRTLKNQRVRHSSFVPFGVTAE